MSKKYTNAFSALHWIHAVLLAMLLLGGIMTLPDLPETAAKLAPFKNHMILGFVASLLVLVRIFMLRSQPKLEPLKMSEARQKLVTWNHRLIYVMIAVTGLTGMATAKSASMGQVLLFGAEPSVYGGPEGITATLGMIHTYSAWILGALIVMHVAGTISYMMKTGDNVLKRVGFGQG
jgi:cytochrome b561